MSGQRIGTVAALALALALALVGAAACSGGESDWRGEGLKLEGVEDSLTRIDESWRSQLLNGQIKVNLPESAKCFLQVIQERDVTNQVICGPFRRMGSSETTWQQGEITFYGGDASDKGIVAMALDRQGRPKFSDGPANPNARPSRPDGAKADLAAKVDEPEAPHAQPGQNVTASADGVPLQEATVVLPTGRLTLGLGVTGERLGGAEDRVAPPVDGSFVVITGVNISDSSSAKVKVSTGGSEYPVEPTSGSSVLAIPTDGKDARVGFDYEGLTQWFSVATGAREGTAAAGYYDGLEDQASGDCPTVEGKKKRGFQRDFRCQAVVSKTAYLDKPQEQGARETVGWAADGMVFLSADISTNYFSRWYAEDDTFWSASYDQAVQVADLRVRLGDKEFKPKEVFMRTGGWGGDSTTAIFEVPAGSADISIVGNAEVTDTLRSSDSIGSDANAPAKGSATLKIDVPITFARTS